MCRRRNWLYLLSVANLKSISATSNDLGELCEVQWRSVICFDVLFDSLYKYEPFENFRVGFVYTASTPSLPHPSLQIPRLREDIHPSNRSSRLASQTSSELAVVSTYAEHDELSIKLKIGRTLPTPSIRVTLSFLVFWALEPSLHIRTALFRPSIY